MQKNSAIEKYGVNELIVLLITILFTGINGLIAFALLMVFSGFNFARDPKNKHGLSSGKSRLGGVAIFLSVIIGCCSHVLFKDHLNLVFLFSETSQILLSSLVIGLIGLIEDLKQNFSSFARLVTMIILVCVSFYLLPNLIPSKLDLFDNFGLGDSYGVIFIFTVIMVSGFINAGNMADGANGLLTVIILGFFIVSYSLDNTIFNFSVVISLLAFVIFNVSTGRIFLGDFGSYFLSALVAFKSLEFYSSRDISVFFLSSLLIYPCFEITRSLIIRTIRSTSVLKPDNNHLHNHINSFLLSLGYSKHLSNSMTGLGIAFSTTVIPIYLFFSGVPVNSDVWLEVFIVKFLLLLTIYIYFEKKFSR